MLTGAGIGGEYAAVNSAIQELIPARLRGHRSVVNGSYWIGAAFGAVARWWCSIRRGAADRLARGLRGRRRAGLVVLFLRRYVPESPRWLITHGRRRKPKGGRQRSSSRWSARPAGRCRRAAQTLRLPRGVHVWFGAGARALFTAHRGRTVLGSR